METREPLHPPLNISKIAVIRCEAKYELTKKGFQEEFPAVKLKFLVQKGKERQKYSG